ncbi:MAG: flagellar basal body protein FliL [Alphaproteobacteria bacterium]|nr:flagellar basal body protein FliL [Alphaproteobacteria bacterium]
MADDDENKKVNASLDDEGGDGGDESAESNGSSFNAKKIVLFVVLPLFILIGAGAGLYFSGTLDKLFAPKEGAEHEVAADEGGHGKKGGHGLGVPGAAFLPMPDMLVNLNTPDGPPRYLRLRVQLELEKQADVAAVEAVMPRVIDQFQTYLRELRVKDLRGSAGIYRLQIELLERVNAAAYPVEVKDVLFQEILIQ